ncbi:MAG: SDR family NAD(P)-dependent oxidoreductase [Halieaceae bacterium]|jgi:NAD(P)-dependent dehydrogenase (short-subunit alcohol dehydrogenase family)|nr:SDR family NAD(P)-dependent oxidoreductase [Halieaceae bacterium]
MQRFENRVALITGAASGIGKASALRLAEEGATVCCVDLNLSAAEATAAEVLAAGGKAMALACDVSDEVQVNETVAACIEQQGSLYALINMAGILRFEYFHETSTASWQQVLDINLNGTFYMCRAAIPHLIESGGSIVNAASTAALTGLHWGVAYSASKGAILAMTRSIAVEYAKQGVRANCVCPGDIKTAMSTGTAMPEAPSHEQLVRISSLNGPLGPEVVAGVIAMLASEDGRHITGEDVRVDGGTLS